MRCDCGAHEEGKPYIYAGEHVIARPAAGLNPLWCRVRRAEAHR